MEMKKTLLVFTMVASTFAMNSMAADIEANVVKNVTEIPTLKLNSTLRDALSKITGTNKEISARSQKGGSSPSSKPATGISYFEVAYVASTKYPSGEAIQNFQRTTSLSHEGDVSVYVFQRGLGNINTPVSGLTNVSKSSEVRCGSDLRTCNRGEIVAGYLHEFEFSGAQAQQSTQIILSADSVVFPFEHWSDSVILR